ncbi:MAG: hypothetical protein AAFZ04_04785 [Pseudomonadota bacterium]
MKNTAAFLLVGALLMACDSEGNPFTTSAAAPATPTTPGPAPATGVPADIAGDVDNVTFNATTGVLTVTGVNLDNVPVTTTYTRTPGLDQDGFIAFTTQDDPLDRHFTALVAEGTSVRAAAVSSPSPRNRTLRGAFFERDGAYTPPTVTTTTGLVSYAGAYAGVTNISDPNPQNLLSTTVTPSELQPTQALLVDGDVFMNADFGDGSVEGNIINRRLLGSDGTVYQADLPSLVLILSTVDSNGSFSGTVEYDISDPASNTNEFEQVGTYAGIFGGTNASEIAGGVDLTEFDGSSDPLGFENEQESGAFVLQACAPGSTNPICAQIP